MLPAVTMETEASHMLEAALEQMDDIIAGKHYQVHGNIPIPLIASLFPSILSFPCNLSLPLKTKDGYKEKMEGEFSDCFCENF